MAYPGCGNTYRSHISLANHIANVHEKIPCSICGEMILTKNSSANFALKVLWKPQDYVIMSILIPVKNLILANFAGLLMLVMEIIESTKEDIWDIKDQSKNLIKKLKSKCGYGYAYCSYISLANHEKKLCSFYCEIISKKCETRHLNENMCYIKIRNWPEI